ncbi:MAG: ComEC/Rec2 family competence protein [Nocardioides sp.]
MTGPDAANAEADPAASDEPDRRDLRMVLLGAAGWGGGLLAFLAPRWVGGAVLAAGLVTLFLTRRRGSTWVLAGCVLAAAAVGASSLVRLEATHNGPVARLAGEHAVVSFTARVASDPLQREGRFGPFVLVRLDVAQVSGRGRDFATSARVLVIGDESWAALSLGETVEGTGRLAPPDDLATAAVLSSIRAPTVVAPAGEVLVGAEAVRAGIRRSLAGSNPEARTLVPALVVGDDRQMPASVVEDFRTCGLTHLAAVSGTNLTLVVGSLLVLARWAGVRARGLLVVGALGVVGFVLVARAEPSVVRAAAMGTVALVGMGVNGRRQGVRALGVATLALLLVDPWLALSFGFVLSVLATAGILFLAPVFRDQLRVWVPRWAAEAVAIPLAAQLVCTPVVAALSGQVSLVAVVANIVVAPAVAPATVLGLLGGLLTLVLPVLGMACGWVAGAFGWWIVAVATHLARLPVAAVEWETGAGALILLTVLCLACALSAGMVLRRRRTSVTLGVVLMLVMVRPLPTPGWPPDGWVMIACDVGQGDAVVLNAGAGRAVVVDAGPDPAAVDRCLDRIGVRSVPMVVLSHFHADHMDGLPGVLADRAVGEVLVTGLRNPETGAAAVDRWAAEAGVPVRAPSYGETGSTGALTWQVVGPATSSAIASEGSAANNASLVLLAQVEGVRILAAGDVEPEAQERLAAALPGLRVDVLKVPHHGSRYQDASWLTSLRSRLAVVSVGEDNDYGHPAGSTVDLLRGAGATVVRTDLRGDVAVVVDGDRLRVVSR